MKLQKVEVLEIDLGNNLYQKRRSGRACQRMWAKCYKYLVLLLATSINSKDSDDQNNLKLATQYMVKGEIQEALIHYDKAIDIDPLNYITYFRRATAYLSVGRYSYALSDFDKVFEIKGDCQATSMARLKRASIHLVTGDVDNCISDINLFSAHHKDNAEAQEILEKCKEAKSHLKKIIKAGESSCLFEELDSFLRICTRSTKYLKVRADCYFKQGNTEQSIFDYSRLLKLEPNQNDISMRLAEIHLSLGELDMAVSSIKECLHSAPEHRGCKAVFRRIKKLQKAFAKVEEMQRKKRWRDICALLMPSKSAETGEIDDPGLIQMIEEEKSKALNRNVYMMACKCNGGMKKNDNAIKYCSLVIDLYGQEDGPVVADARATRGDAYLKKDEFEKAKIDFQKAHDIDSQNQRYVDGFRKAEALLKRSLMKDYYKILGVSRSATPREIKKAYRKQAQIYHPDKYSGELSKDDVLKKMSDINLAYEVLGNEESREKYDHGEDPNDPHQQQQQGNPFGGGNPFAGFNFHQQGGGHNGFHFNF